MVKWILRRCIACKQYTLRVDHCSHCGGQVQSPHPAKFSPDDKYIQYRQQLKKSNV